MQIVNLQIFMRYFPLIILCALFIGCRPEYKPEACFETYNDYENILGWSDGKCNNTNSITKDFGYESKSCTHISSKTPFGYMFKAKYGEISKDVICRVEISAIGKANSALLDSCGIGCSVENTQGQIVLWQEYSLKEILDLNEWQEVNHVFNISGFNGSENQVNVFFWNHYSSQDFFIDNTAIKFYSCSE